jgi:hypothetical protein
VRSGRETLGLWNLDAFRQSVGHHLTNPPKTSVLIDNYLQLTAPGTVTLSRNENHVAQATKDGYEPTSLKIDRTWSWWVVGDIFGCLIIVSPFHIMHDID